MNQRQNWRLDLPDSWKLRELDPDAGEYTPSSDNGSEEEGWIPATVPGDVHTNLLAAGLIPEPFYSTNVEQVQWVEKRGWVYATTFDGPPAPQSDFGREILYFAGLDTYATIFLNGEKLGQHQNMFRPASFDVTGKLNYSQKNRLEVVFDPVSKHLTAQGIEGQWGDYNSNERVFVRKTQSHFSWDWAPRLVNVGIWLAVRLERYTTARLQFPYARTVKLENGTALLALEAEVESWSGAVSRSVTFKLSRGAEWVENTAQVIDGLAKIEVEIENPSLWWPSGYGEQALYDLQVTLLEDTEIIDTFSDRVGICQININQSPDESEPGTQFFTFIVNGVPVFAKGANWIPADSLNGRVDAPRYEEHLRLLVEANGNMLRVWGGGQYERDDFYRLADELGILVWQDFMFACGLYPDFDSAFTAEVALEAEYQVRRLRNHPSLAVWVGNNEVDWIEDVEHWQTPGHSFPGKELYHELLPNIVKRLDPAHEYWPSSPYGGNDHNGEQAGDRHNWQVWHGGGFPRHFGEEPQRDWSPAGVSYRHYAEDTGRFISEFGIHALPVLETIRRNVPESEFYFGSPGLLFRNKDNPKNKGDMLMLAHTGLPQNLPDYIDFSMITQAEGLKYGIEHYRRRKFHCSGTLVWQWNDCWPGLSWSLLDYYAFPKAGYFYLKRAYAPILASFKEEPDGGVSLWVANDTLNPVREELVWQHCTFEGKILHEERLKVEVPANSSKLITEISLQTSGTGNRQNEYLRVKSQSKIIADNRHFFVEIKDLEREKPPVEVRWENEGSILVAHLTSPGFAYFLWLFVPIKGTRYSDNWIELYPGETRTIRIWQPEKTSLEPEQVQLGWR